VAKTSGLGQKRTKRSLGLVAIVATMIMSYSSAYNPDNKLVDYKDKITIVKSTEPLDVVKTMDLYAFPYSDNVSIIISLDYSLYIPCKSFDTFPFLVSNQ